jgi:hypothetical protein
LNYGPGFETHSKHWLELQKSALKYTHRVVELRIEADFGGQHPSGVNIRIPRSQSRVRRRRQLELDPGSGKSLRHVVHAAEDLFVDVHSNKNAPSELFVCIVIRAHEMKRNVRLVANNPAIVARPNVKNVARLHRV